MSLTYAFMIKFKTPSMAMPHDNILKDRCFFKKDIGMLVTLFLSIIVKETPDFSALKQDTVVLPV